ncbi:hypothetical protein ACQKKX_08780 [Neorhizobium sp. NPDC001467]|uniref:hypothetical protein n=1 Tax=Neorhizobium sp. NPDC001467 TaxID=3390595 RepID=UPI003D0703BA
MKQISPKATLWALGLLPVLAVLAYGSWWGLRAALYVPQTVTVSKVETLCSIRSRHRLFIFNEQTAWTSDCEGQKRLFKTKFTGRRHSFKSGLFLSFSYISPADGQRHTGTLRRGHNDQGLEAKPGDRIVIEASRLRPLAITDWSTGSIAEDDRVFSPITHDSSGR